jgi:anti-sigma regulatory factor (Ser/Thr protein kinase)
MAAHTTTGPVVTAGNGRSAPLARTYDGRTDTLRSVRADMLAWLDGGGVDTEAQERAALVVSELAANAVQAAPGRRFEVQAAWEGGHMVVTVRNATDGDRPPLRSTWGPAHALAPRGRGLAIIDALAEGVDVAERDGFVVVTARLRVEGTGIDGRDGRR